MPPSLSVKRKKGRPSTGTGPVYGVRMGGDLMRDITEWADAEGVTRSEAVRRLLQLGLTIYTKTKRPSTAWADRTTQLARKAIEQITDSPAPLDEERRRSQT